jgi:hypothetical protein
LWPHAIPRAQFGLDPQRAVGASALPMNLHDVAGELFVGAAASGRLAPPPRPIPAGGDVQHPAHPADRIWAFSRSTNAYTVTGSRRSPEREMRRGFSENLTFFA